MVTYNKNTFLFSIHLPKTGGTSLDKVLRNWFGLGYVRHYKDHRRNKLPKPLKAHQLRARLFRPICIHGHFNKNLPEGRLFEFYPNANQFIIFMRDPVETQMSMYFYQKQLFTANQLFWNGKKVTDWNWTLDDWMMNRPYFLLNFLPWELNSYNFEKIIHNNFVHVGVLENFQRSVDILAEKLRFKKVQVTSENSSVWDEYPSDRAVSAFKEKHQLEYKIYEFARSLNA